MSNKHDKKLEELEKKFENGVDVVKEIEQQYEYAKSKNYTNSSLKALELLVKVRGNTKLEEVELKPEKLQWDIMNSCRICGFSNWLNLGIANNWIENFEEDISKSRIQQKELVWASNKKENYPTKTAIDYLNKHFNNKENKNDNK